MITARTNVGTVADLHASASRITGLDDFGAPSDRPAAALNQTEDDNYDEGLRVLLDSYANEAALTPLGSKAKRSMLRGALVARLLGEAAWREHPEHASTPIIRPIFITGLPRTGTTALHRLLAADPAHQGPELWLTEVPQPRPPRETWAGNPVFAALQEGYRSHPELRGVHDISADQVEECWQLLRQSMTSVSFECLAFIPTYSRWLRGRDWHAAYRRHRRNLQLIGMWDADRRWVLKNPSHLFALPALLAAYPDALVIQTHREPRAAIASVCSLNARAAQGWSEVFRAEVVGRTQLDLWADGLRRFMDDRAGYDPDQFLDVHYDDFVADPMGTVAAIYARLGSQMSDEARSAMAARHSRGGPEHRYALADFGLTGAAVDERFAGYLAVHGR